MAPGSMQESFIKLIDSHKGIIIKIASTYCQDKAAREDLIQEIIYTLWKYRDRYDAEFRFSTWLYKVALNVAITFYRIDKKQRYIILVDDFPDLAAAGNNEDDIAAENFNLLQKAISTLNEFDRALILLYFEERSYREIADIIGISETNVATKLSRIKEKIRQLLQNLKKV